MVGNTVETPIVDVLRHDFKCAGDDELVGVPERAEAPAFGTQGGCDTEATQRSAMPEVAPNSTSPRTRRLRANNRVGTGVARRFRIAVLVYSRSGRS
jgi:hypothetical protein